MHDSTVEKRTLGQTEVGDGVPVIEPFDVWPVLLSCGRAQLGQCAFKFHLTFEGDREDQIDVGLVTIDNSAIRQGDADRQRFHTGPWSISERGTEVEQMGPFPRVLGACNLPIGAVHKRVCAISEQPDRKSSFKVISYMIGNQYSAHVGKSCQTPADPRS